ncbi:NUDIX hydrolase [Phormidium sp. CCY1219]|uniref:NUDIX hydrolase n=1 Tax=Phormidium sp. CCY1219 TaxID=2886104 RepID=UPI002D1F6399|nr:NUDIX domain-containing protein [Phormidium sp. CCY1219]MEB3826893.1 NUDIX domain-containing protein [Phormidium sp. CCY1219]
MSSSSSSEAHAVKAIIYRDDGCLLIQQRDNTPGLPFPNTWTLFGGLVESGESLEDALKRELIEELGCLPGSIESELFQWEWQGEDPALNHIFTVYCQVGDLVLMEGQAMGWYSLESLKRLVLTPLVSENVSKISAFLAGITIHKNK